MEGGFAVITELLLRHDFAHLLIFSPDGPQQMGHGDKSTAIVGGQESGCQKEGGRAIVHKPIANRFKPITASGIRRAGP